MFWLILNYVWLVLIASDQHSITSDKNLDYFKEKLFQKHPAKMLKIIYSLPANTGNKYNKILTLTLLEVDWKRLVLEES